MPPNADNRRSTTATTGSGDMTETATIEAGADRKPRRNGRPPKGESIAIREQIVKLGKNTKNLPMREIAEVVGVSINTVSDVLAKYGINKTELDSWVDNRVDIVRSKQKMVLDAITPRKVQKSTFKDLAVGYGILLDKDRLESGQSTANISSIVSIATKAEAAQNDASIDGKE